MHPLSAKLPEVSRETWPDGREVIFLRSPFKVQRKPYAPSRLPSTAVEVDIETLIGSQSTVTQHGLEQELAHPSADLPRVIYLDGVNYIQDGHHRLVAAYLRGDKTVRVNQVKAPQPYTAKTIQYRGAVYRRVAAVPREKLLAVLASLEQANQELVETLQLYGRGTPMYLELKQAILDNEQHRAVVQRELAA